MSETPPKSQHRQAKTWLARLRRFFPWMLAAAMAVGAFRLRIDTEVLNVLPASNEAARGLAEHQKNFLDADEALVVVRSSDAESTEAAARAIHAAGTNAPSLVKRAYWQPPANESLESLGQFLAYLWLNSPTGAVQAMAERLALTNLNATLAETKHSIATSLNPSDMLLLPRDPLGLSRVTGAGENLQSSDRYFSSEDGLTRIVYLYAAAPLKDYEDCRRWVSEVRELARRALPAGGGATFGLTGRAVFVDEISSGMKKDLSTAVPGTLLTIGVLFFLLHREVRSLALLLGTLALVLGCTALSGAALLGELNVLSIGFASILLGLAEDFGIVLHHESKLHPRASASEIRAMAGRGILGSALTTAAAFALLNLSSLPGLRALGTLVALGIGLGAWAMLFLFLPLVVRWKGAPRAAASPSLRKGLPVPAALLVTLALAAASVIVAVLERPAFEGSPDVLRPRQSEASETLQVVQKMIGAGDPYWLIVKGATFEEVGDTLKAMEAHLSAEGTRLGIEERSLPLAIWPDAENQKANRALLRSLAAESEALERQVLAEGFTEEALALSRAVWKEWREGGLNLNWPRGELAAWVLPKMASARPDSPMALGIIRPGDEFVANEVVPESLKDRVTLTGWGLLGKTVMTDVLREVPIIVALAAATVTLALWLTFRSVAHVLACLATLLFAGLVLVAAMGLAGMKWNLINVTGVPLLLGMGIDYSIHILAAFDRCGRDPRATFASVGSALLLAGSTSIAGFFFLALSFNTGMASLGAVCALGLAILLLTSVFLLPAWAWLFLRGDRGN